MGIHPRAIDFGAFSLTSFDGTTSIPADLWPELHVAMALESMPDLLGDWVRRLQVSLKGAQAAARFSAVAAPPARCVSTGKPWTILAVTPMMERKVAETLKDAGLNTYVPLQTYQPRRLNARTGQPLNPRQRAQLPGYVFALLETDADLDIARANAHVHLWCRAGKPVTVPSMVVGVLVLFEACGAFDETRNQPSVEKPKKPKGGKKASRRGRRGAKGAAPRWAHGQRIKIQNSPFAGFEAVVQADHGEQIDVLVSLFGRETSMVLEEGMIEEGG